MADNNSCFIHSYSFNVKSCQNATLQWNKTEDKQQTDTTNRESKVNAETDKYKSNKNTDQSLSMGRPLGHRYKVQVTE